MLIFIVPTFTKMFTQLGGELPTPTKLLVGLSHCNEVACPDNARS